MIQQAIDQRLDELVCAAAQCMSRWGRPTPTAMALGELRESAANEALARVELRLSELAEVFATQEQGQKSEQLTDAKNELVHLANLAFQEMRVQVDHEAHRSWRGPLADFDRSWRETHTIELIDRPNFDKRKRVRLMAGLDHMNVTLGTYASFFDALRPFLRTDRPTRIHDLAAGHGGFLLEVANIAKREGLQLELVASDIAEEYLEMGRAQAAATGLPVRFEVQDALDTSNLAEGAYDIVVCTQSLHHFPPGLIALLTHEVLRIASRAVVLIDGARSKLNAALGILRYRDIPFAHDSWVSLRRFFTPEELGLLARIGALAAPHRVVHTKARFLAPGHIVTVLERPLP